MSDARNGSDPLADRVAALSPAKRALLELRLRQQRAEHQAGEHGLPPILSRGPHRSAPLSFAQQRLWFLDELQPGRPLYNVPCRAWLDGRLDVAALQRALNEIVARHESLRTTFPASDGEPLQAIARQASCELPLIDLAAVPAERRESEVRRIATEQAREPFDLARGPLIRARLLRLAEEEHALILMLHHIVADGWSVGVLFRELGTLYEAFSQGQASPLPELPIQYADYALTQREWLQGAVLERELGYWKGRFPTLPAPLRLPADRPRPSVPTHAGARVQFIVPAELRDRLEELSRSGGATLFMALLAAFKLLLARCTGQEDIVVGTPIAGRTRPETEGLIGCFVNTLALHTDLSDDPTFVDLLARVREAALGAYAHQELPFERLVEALQPERDGSQAPLFNVMFVLQNVPRSERRLRGLTMRHIELDKGTAKFDLGLSMAEGVDGLRGVFTYKTDLFDPATIERLTSCYRVLLESIVADPGRRISALPILTEVERHRVVEEWNATAQEYPRHRCVHQLFEDQVARTPRAIAVRCGADQLTYDELNRRANQLARHLQGRGVGPEVRVGLCLERSLDLAVGLLAILKAGGAYVPLEATYPQERIAFLLGDAGVTVLVTSRELSSGLRPLSSSGVELVCMDRDWKAIATTDGENLPCRTTAEHLAYVIYTSGSTGASKGVAVPHRAVVNLSNTAIREYRITADDRVLQSAPLTSDFSVEELFPAWMSGATVVLRPPAALLTGADFTELLDTGGISITLMPTAFWHSWVQELHLSRRPLPATLRLVSIGGETVQPAMYALWRELAGGRVRWFNTYGPTEATVEATLHEPAAGLVASVSDLDLPIGRPLANTRVYVLDRHLNPVPVGAPGELYIGGVGVARGYLGRAALTAERFVPDPFGGEPGARLYRTGDRGRYRTDGNLEFLGRLDYQVKIRGFRVEPEEVEAVLAGHPAVREDVVIAREDTPGDRRLVAYVVPAADRAVGSEELRGFLQERLPESMVPSAFVLLDALPLTPNGKIDRRALPAPDYARPDLAEAFVAPRTPIEERVAAIWAAVLKLDRVGVHDDFFALGGHSLLATQVVARLRTAFGVELPLRGLFEAPTVAGLAERLDETRRLPSEPEPAGIPKRAPDGRAPLSFAQQRLWFLQRLEPESTAYNIPFAARLTGTLDVLAFTRALESLAARHEVLRTTFAEVDGTPVQVVGRDPILRLPVTDLSAKPEAEREMRRLAAQEARVPFDLERGPLVRARLLRLADQDHVFLLTVHHVIADGWSMGVLWKELAALYRGLVTGTPAALPGLPIQYADYAAWQRQPPQTDLLERQLQYWKGRLSDAPRLLELPTDPPASGKRARRGARASLVLPKRLADDLRSLSHQEGATLFMTLLAAFKILLSRWSGQEDIVVGTPIAGRTRTELEGLIGCFLNTLVLRTDLSGEPSFRELLGRVRETALGAYAHQELPFERLVEELQPVRSLGHNPLFRVLFQAGNTPGSGGLKLHRLAVSRVESGGIGAKFDLSFRVRERSAGLACICAGNPELFGSETLEHLMAQFGVLLEQIVATPGGSIGSYSLVTEGACASLPDPRVALPEPAYPLATDVFEAVARESPSRTAVEQSGRRWTYGELAARVQALSHALAAGGLRRGDIAAITGPPSFGLIAGMLAILGSGAVMLPIAPDLPARRRRLMIQEARAGYLLQVGDPEADAQWLQGLETLVVRQISEHSGEVDLPSPGAAPGGSVPPPPPRPTPEDPAYIFFTSGTTGTPRAVLGTHKGLSHFLAWQSQTFGVTSTDRSAQLTNISFDVILRDVLLPLWSGATLCLPPHQLPPDQVLGWLGTAGITLVHTVPSVANAWLAQAAPGLSLPSLRLVFSAGEPLIDALVLKWRRLVREDCEVVNLYGPTETTMVKCFYRVPDQLLPGVQPVGRALPQAQALVLAGTSRLCGVNELGEIVLRTPYRTRGYLNAADAQERQFLANPFGSDPDDVVYRTGDLGRYRPDGNLTVLARLDQQVKIRGVRIEPDEITAVLSRHPEVAACAVVARTDQGDDAALVAYLVADRDRIGAPELRVFLAERLPAAQIPSAFVFLDRLPLTPNGKLDRRALPAPAPASEASERPYVAPRTPIEGLLAEMWSEVLGVPRVGVHDDFFGLGGHSLKATQVIARARGAFQVELPLRSLFETPTVAGLSLTVARRLIEDTGADQ